MSAKNTTTNSRRADHPWASASRGTLVVLLLAYLLDASQAFRADPGTTLGAAAAQLRFDPNTATRDELLLLPDIGPKLGDAIIAYRDSAGRTPAFASADDLTRVRGIGPTRAAKLRPHLRFDGPVVRAPGSAP